MNLDKKKTADQRVENTMKRVAHALNLLETASQEMRWACESMNWNDEVTYQIEDGMMKLGMALATLVRWNDEDADESEI